MKITLYCSASAGLHLGPAPDGDIVFINHFATFDSDDLPDWERWINAPGSPDIEVVPGDEQVSEDTPNAISCGVCAEAGTPRFFKSKANLGSHLRSHVK